MATRPSSTEPRTSPPDRAHADHNEHTTDRNDHTFKKWIRLHRPRLLSVAARYAHGSVGAEDIVQNASAAAYNALHTLDDPEAAGAWLAGFVRNVGRQEARKHARQSSLLEAYAATAQLRDSRHSEDAVLVKLDVRKAIDELPQVQRTRRDLPVVQGDVPQGDRDDSRPPGGHGQVGPLPGSRRPADEAARTERRPMRAKTGAPAATL